jgi:dephospho-CoA kinase
MKPKSLGYLVDKPLDKTSKLAFGHLETALTLKEIVELCPCPYTIGVFGGWGSGKSTIAKFLQKKLDFPVVIFDVWKHEKDSLRRTFLKVLEKDGQRNPRSESKVKTPWLKKSFHLKENVFIDTNVTITDSILKRLIQTLSENKKIFVITILVAFSLSLA